MYNQVFLLKCLFFLLLLCFIVGFVLPDGLGVLVFWGFPKYGSLPKSLDGVYWHAQSIPKQILPAVANKEVSSHVFLGSSVGQDMMMT